MTRVLHSAVLIAALALVAEARAQVPSHTPTLPICAGDLVKANGGRSTVDALIDESIAARSIVLGERHGVKAHPEAAVCVIRALLAKAPRAKPHVVLEMLAADQQPAVDTYRRQHPELVDGLGSELRWWQTGWPAWSVYAPLFDVAWLARLPVRAGDLPRSIEKLPRTDIENVFAGDTKKVLVSWQQAMLTAHCNQIDVARADALAERQASRDIAMARAASASLIDDQAVAVLYVGRAHAAKDRSIPLILRNLPGAKAPVSVALQETAAGGVKVDRAAVLKAAAGRFDYVWFVGDASQGDACESLKAKGLIADTGTRK